MYTLRAGTTQEMNDTQMPLTASHAPRSSLGCLFSDVDVASLRAWMRGGVTGPALATAATGSGLTTLVSLLIRENELEPVWVGCGTPRIRALLDECCACPVSATMRRKIVVIDEFDAMLSCDSTSAAECLAAAKKHRDHVPMLFLAHPSRSQKALEFAKTWPAKFAFGRPGPAVLAPYLTKVCDRHGIDPSVIPSIVGAVRGDVRAALMALELHLPKLRAPPPDTPAQFHKDEAADPLDLVEAVLRGDRGRTVRDCLHVFSAEPSVLPMGLFENYLAVMPKDDIRGTAAAAHDFSSADLVDNHMFSKQAWELSEAYGTHGVAGPVMSMKRKAPGASITKFGSVWSKAYNSCAKMKHVRALALACNEAGRTALSPCELAHVRGCLKRALANEDDEAVRRVCEGLSSQHVLLLVRLDAGPGGSAWYKQALKNRVKRVLDEF